MIRGLIICEGNTDRTLLGLYVEGISTWNYTKTMIDNPFPKGDISWYTNGAEYIGIWENGSSDFNHTIEEIAQRESMEHSIERVLIVTDNDDESAETNRPQSIYDIFCGILDCDGDTDTLKVNGWNTIKYESGFGKADCLVGYLLVPMDEKGALETFMLNALAENKKENKETINQVEDFIDSYSSDVYLKKRRDRVKAKLGISLSIFEPDKSFYVMKEILYSVDWGKFEESDKQFEMVKVVLGL